MVGGDPSLRDRVTPLLKSYGRLIEWMGPVGSGQKMKVLNNVLGFATGQIANIAIETGVALGLDPASLVAVLESGSAASFALHSLLHNMIPDPVFTAHAATMIAKDTELFQQVCRRGELSPTVLEQLAVDRITHPVPDVALTIEQHGAAIGETRTPATTPLGSESPW
jgi:3-hydroxyisobutyrate dehydrogenase-like beta-hydroxyacid dehydrogenase